MPALAIRLFGRLEIAYGGTPWKFSAPPRVTPLLAYLLLHAGEHLERIALANLFWPDEPDDVARTNLRRHLHEVARALPEGSGHPWISATMETISWPVRDDVWIDVHEFERCASDPERATEAIEMYRGDLLKDFYEEWLMAEQERLRARFHELCFAAAERARSEREFALALRYADRILADDEWREDAIRLSMAIKYESGDRTGALTDFTQFAGRLKKELGVDPMPETTGLRSSILANALLVSSQYAEDRIDASGAPFVGRSAELETLLASWSRAARGGGGTIFIGGEAGIGKSRLVGELAERVQSEGGRVLVGGTSNGEAFPYEPIVEALHRNVPMLVEARIDRNSLVRLAQLLPELASALPDLPAGGDADPVAARASLLDAIARTVEQLGRSRPLLLALEDLHWANQSTIDALAAIARRIGTAPVLLVVTYRVEELTGDHPLHPLLAALKSDRRASLLTLKPFSENEVEELARETVGEASASHDVAATVYELCAGNALFAVQLLHGFVETGKLPARRSSSGLAGAVLARIESLDDRSRALAETGSIVGRSFTIEMAARTLGWSEDAALDAVTPLLERSIVRTVGSTSFAYTFTHALIADVIYESTPESRRTARHRRIAHVMSDFGELEPSALATVARHWQAAHEQSRAAAAFERAAVRAAEVYAYDEALESCALVLALTQDDATRIRVLLMRESIEAVRADREPQLRDLDALEDIARDRNDDALEWEVLRRRATLARATSDHAAEERLLAELERRATESDNHEWRAEAQLLQTTRGWNMNDLMRAQEYGLAALDGFARLKNFSKQMEALLLLVRIEADLGNLERARRYIAQAADLSGVRDRHQLVNANLAAGYAANQQQDFAATLGFANEGLELARKAGNRDKEADCLNLIGIAQTRFGDFAAARHALEAARDIFIAIGRRTGLAAHKTNMGLLNLRMGRLDLAYEFMSAAYESLRELDHASGQLIASTNLSSICIRLGRMDEGMELAQTALQLGRESGNAPFEGVARGSVGFALLSRGEAAAAIPYIEESIALQKSLGRHVDAVENIANLALANAATGNVEAARNNVTELATHRDSFATAVWPQQLYWSAAQVYHALGEKALAKGQLELAVAAMSKLAATISKSADAEPFLGLPLNESIRRAKSDDAWPEVGRVGAEPSGSRLQR